MAGARCTPPKAVTVKSYYRTGKPKKRRKKRVHKPPTGRYYTIGNGNGRSCGHYHRTARGAGRCLRDLERRQRMSRARLSKAQLKKYPRVKWGIELHGPRAS